ncbi:MAG: VWA domain-containing protein [Gammaproteobacteria bacterium]|nr:VWA domain-containing protein [Gammaproteobacteria bacterium]
MKLKKILTYLLCMGLLAFAAYGHAQGIEIFTNKTGYNAGDPMEVSVAVNREQLGAAVADVYLAAQLPDGELFYMHKLDPALFAESNIITPLSTGWPVFGFSKTVIFAFPLPDGLSGGTYKWYLTLVEPGRDVAQPANWIANASVTFTLSGADLSMTDPLYGKVLSPPDGESAMAACETCSSAVTGDMSVSPGGGADMGDAGSFEPVVDDMFIYPPPPDNIQSGTLTAGDIDDNLNFAAFLRYLSNQAQANYILPFMTLSDRVELRIQDSSGQGISHARLRVGPEGMEIPALDTYTGSDGRFYLFPEFDGLNSSRLTLQLAAPGDEFASSGTSFTTTLDLSQTDGGISLTLPNIEAALPDSLDLMLVIDATGSMRDEMRYLSVELRDIIAGVYERYSQTHIRFGLVVYRDHGDAYVVREFPFTDSLNLMQAQVSEQRAGGGGDYPEAMEEGLAAALQAGWRGGNTARVLLLAADAPPHNGNLDAMLEQARIARQMGVRIYPVGASGVADTAEYILRGSAVLTQGRYLFLTDDSGVGGSHAEPTVSCYVVTRLDQLISRVISAELGGQRVEPEQAEIFRSVGNYNGGICEMDAGQQ